MFAEGGRREEEAEGLIPQKGETPPKGLGQGTRKGSVGISFFKKI